jgi:UDP-N-acetylmuramate--alanine ligase
LLKDIKRIHFIGIGGYGMSALARVLLHLGCNISGSDLQASEITEKLALKGAKIHFGHAAENLGEAELVVYSTAIPDDNPELLAARGKGLPVWHRSELLAHFMNARFGIAVAGAHGKTTTTSMVALVLTRSGQDPTAFIGGLLADFDGNARLGDSKYLVAEACESDHSFLRYRPDIAVVTNIEADHLEHYGGDFNRLLDAYQAFLKNIKPGGCAVLYAPDPHLEKMELPAGVTAVTYGREQGADWRADSLAVAGWGTRFNVFRQEMLLGEVTLRVPGVHNVDNALAALAAADCIGLSFADIKEGLEQFFGTKRRFQFLYNGQGITVVDDYAHHPTEVEATLKAARYGKPERVTAIFQPHRYNRTKLFMDEFAAAFDSADKVYLHKIYSAGEQPIPGITSAELAGRMLARGINVIQLDEADEIIDRVVTEARRGDLILSMGAGDVTDIGHSIARRLLQRGNSG